MKVAIVYDAITEFGGAERVLQALLHAFPNAHLMTLIADPAVIKNHFPMLTQTTLHTHPLLPAMAQTHTSFLQAAAPLLWKHFDFSSFDLVISTPAHLMANLISVPNIHIQYVHSLPKNCFGVVRPTPLQRYTHYDSFCVPMYTRALHKTPYILTNSRHMKQTILKYTHAHATVIHPPIIIPHRLPRRHPNSYYLYVGRIDREKHIELGIKACNDLGVPFIIVGATNEPQYEQYLRSIAGSTITFLGYQTDKHIHALYQGARAVLFTSKNEDFGIAPLEAMAHGVPVISYYGGGARETVIEGKTGRFFYTHSWRSLRRVMETFQPKQFKPEVLYSHAKLYGETVFLSHIKEYIGNIQRSG